MNYVEQVAEMLGVEMGEIFYTLHSEEPYRFCEGGLYRRYEGFWYPAEDLHDYTLLALISGKDKIIKSRIAWKPALGESFWYVGVGGDIRQGHYCHSTVDMGLFALENCFKTKQRAVEHREEILAKMEALQGGWR